MPYQLQDRSADDRVGSADSARWPATTEPTHAFPQSANETVSHLKIKHPAHKTPLACGALESPTFRRRHPFPEVVLHATPTAHAACG